MADARALLAQAILALGGGDAMLVDAASRHWASATFVGERHALVVTLPPDAADTLAGALPEHEFEIPGQLVADITIVDRAERGGIAKLGIEALVIEAH